MLLITKEHKTDVKIKLYVLLLALYLNALRLGSPADDERCGGVGSEDVGT